MADTDIKNLKGVIDRFEGDKAFIRLDDSQELIWPKESLSEGLAEGSSVCVVVMGDNDFDEQRKEIAKNILKEILKADE